MVEFSLFATVVIDQIWKLRNFTWSKLTEISRLELPAKLLEYIESLAWSRQEQQSALVHKQPMRWQKPSCKYIQNKLFDSCAFD